MTGICHHTLLPPILLQLPAAISLLGLPVALAVFGSIETLSHLDHRIACRSSFLLMSLLISVSFADSSQQMLVCLDLSTALCFEYHLCAVDSKMSTAQRSLELQT